jgi:competence protein ComEA
MLKEIYQKYILKNYKLIIMGCSIAMLLLILFIIGYNNHKHLASLPKQEEVVSKVVKEEPSKEEQKDIQSFYVDIKGAVIKPGVYQLQEGARIIDVINLAGGLAEGADTSLLNLSKKIKDEMVIMIYTQKEINAFKEKGETKEEVIKYIEKECVCPDPSINDACINDTPTEGNSSESSKISLNSATKEELMTLSGIGDAKAQSIIDYRTTNGPFKSVEDIKNITGIGDSIFDKIKDYITL